MNECWKLERGRQPSVRKPKRRKTDGNYEMPLNSEATRNRSFTPTLGESSRQGTEQPAGNHPGNLFNLAERVARMENITRGVSRMEAWGLLF